MKKKGDELKSGPGGKHLMYGQDVKVKDAEVGPVKESKEDKAWRGVKEGKEVEEVEVVREAEKPKVEPYVEFKEYNPVNRRGTGQQNKNKEMVPEPDPTSMAGVKKQLEGILGGIMPDDIKKKFNKVFEDAGVPPKK